jgi:Bacterial Ig-like domain
MSKTYQIKINQGKDSKSFDIPVAGAKGQALSIKAVAGARHQLIDSATGFAPENIRASRQGKDLKVSFEGSNTTDLVIEDYYKVSSEGYNGLIGESEPGRFYEYIPENASGFSSVPMLAESGQVVGMALGGAEVAPAGAAVGVLAAGIVSPWLLGAGALGAAAAAGGGGGAAADKTAPTGQTGALAVESDSGFRDHRTNFTTPTISGTAEANSAVEVSFRDSKGNIIGPYKTTADANGHYSVKALDALPDNAGDTKGTQYTPVIKITDSAGNSSISDGTPFVVDTQALNLTLAIDADANNDGVITVIENDNSTLNSDLKVTASFDSAKANVDDEVHFQMADGVDQKVTLTQAMIDAGKAVFSFAGSIVDKAALQVSSWFVDVAQNKSASVMDKADVDLTVAVHLGSIAGDNMINAAEATTGGVLVRGTATAPGTVTLIMGATQIASTEVNADGSWSCQIDGTKFSSGTPLTAQLRTDKGAIATDIQENYIYDKSIEVLVVDDSGEGLYTLQGNESGANKLVVYKGANDVWEVIPAATSVVLNDSTEFLMADVSGNVLSKYSGTDSKSEIVEYSTLNNATNPSILDLSQLLPSSDGLHIDSKTLAVKSVNIADGKANTLNIDLLDVLNHGVLDVLNAGLGKNPQFKIDGDASDTLNLTNTLHGLGVWTAAETVVSSGHPYTHYSGYALGLEVDLLVNKNIDVIF